MAWHGARHVVDRDTGERRSRRWMRRSPTSLIMVGLPLVASACWAWVVVMLATN